MKSLKKAIAISESKITHLHNIRTQTVERQKIKEILLGEPVMTVEEERKLYEKDARRKARHYDRRIMIKYAMENNDDEMLSLLNTAQIYRDKRHEIRHANAIKKAAKKLAHKHD